MTRGPFASSRRDLGLTLIELLISISLTMIIGGVVSAALITSMNAASSTAAQAADSTDAQLIAAYLTRDAQAAGGTDPDTAQLVADLGVSTSATTVGWSGCAQTGDLVVRFSWIDRGAAIDSSPVVVTYALASDGTLVRRACEGSAQTDVTLARNIESATATCSPGGVCEGLPDQVTLTVRGGAAATPFDYTLTASLRGEVQTSPTSVNSAQAPLVVLRDTDCPVLSVAGSGTTFVRGDLVVAAGCGASPISGDLTKLSVSGGSTLPTSVSDPFSGLAAPSATCGAGTNPTLGASAGAGAVNVHPQAVTITGAVVFQPGRYVFCNGVTVAAGASVSGTDVLWYVADGAVTVSSGASVDLAAATTGTYANLVLWAAGTQVVTIGNGAAVHDLRGMVYAPRTTVTVASTTGTRIGGMVAAAVSITGSGPTRFGSPSPTLTVAGSQMPDGGTGTPYSGNAPVVGGGTSPYSYTAAGLPPGLSMSSTGVVSGTPSTSGASTVSFVVADATGASVAFSRTITIGGAPAGCPTSTPGWWGQYWSNASLTGAATMCRADASLSFDWADGSPDPAIPSDNFSARWTRTAEFAAGDYVFTAGSDDGLRLYVDGTLVLDRWTTRAMTYDDVTRTLTAGSHTIVMEAFDAGGTAAASLSFGTAAPVSCPSTVTGWRGEYWSNRQLTGSPVACQDDAVVDFDWGGGKPSVLPNSDNFGVRWTRTQEFLAGTYAFQVGGDDGVRLSVDGVRVLDAWYDTGYAIRTYTGALSAGEHTIVMDFYENGGQARATLGWSVPVVPASPTNLVVVPGDTTATATWSRGVSSGEPATTVFTATATAPGQTTRTCTAGPPTTTCTLTGLTNAITYAVSVTATNSVGTSAPVTTSTTPRPAVLAGSGLQLWLDASDPDGDGTPEGAAENCDTATTCASVSNALTRWEDKSGRGNDAVQPTASLAGRFVSATSAVNFDSNGWYTTSVAVSPDETVFVVAQSDTATWNQYGWVIASRRPNGFILHPWPGGTTMGWYATNAAGQYLYMNQVAVPSLTAPHIYDLTQAGSNPIVSSGSLDGSVVADNVSFAGQVRTAASSVPIILGADDVGGGRLGDGKYREVIVFDRALSSTERREVQEYLARRWAVAITPAAPAAPTVVPGNGDAVVSFTAPVWDGGSPVTGHRVTAAPGGASCTATAPATSCTVGGLTNGTGYTFTVAAINAVGTGVSSPASTTARPGPPPAPTSVSGTVADSSSVVSWTAPVLNGQAPVTSYAVTATASGQTTQTCTTTAPSASCTVTGLANYVTYTLSVTASNTSGPGAAGLATVTPDWTPTTLGTALSWWYDANDAAALTGQWVTQPGYTVSGAAGSTRITASSGVVERIDVLAGGTGYTSAPTLTITGGSGSGAAVSNTTVVAGAVTSTMVPTRGSGYTGEPTVTVSGPGTGARFRAFIVASPPVGATIRIAGQNYTVTDRDGLTLTISPALAATASAVSIDEWRVSSWTNKATPGTLDATQSTVSEQPMLGTMAGRPAVVFDGIDTWMSILDNSGATSWNKGSAWTVLVAYQADRQVSWGAVGQTSTGANTRIVATSGGGVSDYQSGENIQVNPGVGTDAAAGGPVRIATATGNGSDTFDWTRAFIGGTAAVHYSPGWGLAGRIGEIIVVGDGLGSADVAKAQAYLNRKWSQVASVPSAPIAVLATPGDTQAVVTWRGANQYSSAISTYTVTATSAGRPTQTCASATLTCTLTGLVNGAAYTVTVTATNATGVGPGSVPIVVIPSPALLTTSSSKVWLDSADLDGDGRIEGPTVEDGTVSGAVQTWADKSGRGNSTAAPSVADRPSAVAQTMNGLPVITFNGTTILQAASATNPYGITGDRTLFVVTRRRSGTPPRVIDRTPEDSPLFDINGANQLEVRDDAGGQYQVYGAAGSTTNAITLLSAQRSGTALNIWSDAALSGTGTFTGTQTQRAITVGRHVAYTAASDHDVAEVILFDRALTSAERRQVEDYLRIKWGATIIPDAPRDLTPVAGDGRTTVNWTAPGDGGSPIIDYTVQYKLSSSPTWTSFVDGVSSAPTATVTGLTVGATYDFRVSATNAVGSGAWSATMTAQTAAAWSPAALAPSVVRVWVDASSSASVTLNGTKVSAWNDRSPYAAHLTQPTAGAQPTYVTAEAGLPNGRPVVRFDGSTTVLDGTWTSPPNAATIAFVAKDTGTTTNVGGVFSSGCAGWGVYSEYGSDYVTDGNGGWQPNSANTTSSIAAWRTISATYTQTSTTGTSIWTNGALEEGWVGGGVGVSPGPETQLGGRTCGGFSTRLYKGDIAEVVVTDGTLSTSDRQALEGYLAWKWGTQAGLPAGHPHRTAAPVVSPVAPGAPASASATPAASSATVSWTAPGSDGHAALTTYTATATATGQVTRTCTATAPTQSCGLTGLTAGVTYTVSVTATNVVGTGPPVTTTVTPT